MLSSRLRGGLGDNADETRAAGSLAYGGGGTQVRIDGAYLDADDYDIDGNSATDGSGSDGRLLNSALEKTSGSVAVGQFGSRGSLAANLSRYESTYGLPIEEEAFIDLEQDRLDLEGRLLQPFEGVDSIRLRYGRGDYEHTEFEPNGEPGSVFTNEAYEARVELTSTLPRQTRLHQTPQHSFCRCYPFLQRISYECLQIIDYRIMKITKISREPLKKFVVLSQMWNFDYF